MMAEMGNWHQHPNSAVAKVNTSYRLGKIDLTRLVCKEGIAGDETWELDPFLGAMFM